ncbi:hypothetical protein J1N35_020679, partial [Gossypium stocksii]
MAEHVKVLQKDRAYGDEVIHGCFSKVGAGRLKGLVSITTNFIFFFFLFLIPALLNWMDIQIIFSLLCPGRAEVNIKPREETLKAIKKGGEGIKWTKREPYAYWKGNPYVAKDRVELLKCNLSDKNDWNVRIYKQDWGKESQQSFKHSKLEDQCTHRYKIYMGVTWCVSQKYILACDSMTLLIKPKYYDFFSISMVPMQHYWPTRRKNKCRDLKFAVEWSNNHPHEAQAIGKARSKFIKETLTMQNVYDYMFHLLNEYSKLLKFKPTIPPKAHKACAESAACLQKGLWKDFMVQSMVKSPSH